MENNLIALAQAASKDFSMLIVFNIYINSNIHAIRIIGFVNLLSINIFIDFPDATKEKNLISMPPTKLHCLRPSGT